MPSSKPQSKVLLTEAQSAAEAEAIKRSGLSVSDFRRKALQLFIESFGVKFPDDMPAHGGWREPAESAESFAEQKRVWNILRQDTEFRDE